MLAPVFQKRWSPVVKATIQRIDGKVIVLSDGSLWEAVNLVSDLSTWKPGDEVLVTGPKAWAKMINTRTTDLIPVGSGNLTSQSR